MGTQLPSQKGEEPPIFGPLLLWPNGWMHQMPLGMEVGLSPGDFVFDGDPATPRKKGTPIPHPIFGPCILWPNGWMDEDATWYGSRPRPGHFVLDGFPAIRERAHPPPLFGPCLLWPRSPVSATAELLLRLGFVNAPTSHFRCQPNFAQCLAVSWYTFSGAVAP